MELDQAFRFAVILGWEELRKESEPSSVRLEYEKEPGAALDNLRVWADKPKGYQFLVCNFWRTTTSAHPSGTRFANGYHSDELAQGLDFIMKNQDQFTHPADAGRFGLVLIYPPGNKDHAEAAAWMAAVHDKSTQIGA